MMPSLLDCAIVFNTSVDTNMQLVSLSYASAANEPFPTFLLIVGSFVVCAEGGFPCRQMGSLDASIGIGRTRRRRIRLGTRASV